MSPGSWPPIPAWQQTALQQLGSTGKLYGVDPIILGVIDQEESGGQGGGVNSSGYGGFFGLGADQQYPGGVATRAMLEDPSQSGFLAQAPIAASAFSSYLTKAGGNPVAAEQYYQTGSFSGAQSPGAKLMAQYTSGLQPTGSVGTSPGSTLTAYNAPQATAGGGQGGAPYVPSVIPGVPAQPPAFPDFTANPSNELSRVFSWATEFGGWAIFIVLVFLVGFALFMLGLILLGVVLLGPVAKPVAEGVGATAIVKKVGKARTAARTESTHQRRREEATTDRESRALAGRATRTPRQTTQRERQRRAREGFASDRARDRKPKVNA